MPGPKSFSRTEKLQAIAQGVAKQNLASRRRRRMSWGKKLGYDPNKTMPGGGTTKIGWTPPTWKQIKKNKKYEAGAMQKTRRGRTRRPRQRPPRWAQAQRRPAMAAKRIDRAQTRQAA